MSTLFLRRQRSSESEAPSTILRSLRELRMVPLPRFAGAGARDPVPAAHQRASFVKQRCQTAVARMSGAICGYGREASMSSDVGWAKAQSAVPTLCIAVSPHRSAWASLREAHPTNKKEREAERRQTHCRQSRTERVRSRHGRSGLHRPSALGRARLPAFHHGSCQGVCLVPWCGPGQVSWANPSKRRGSLRRRPDHFQRRTSHAGHSAGRHDARTTREPS